ncbi:hypothetical protein BDY19DRAFT_195870 [Irpex rosettiformis]|uniref:Uncharacterized protein n=1 Tax=Irpex rosettiformis TaxID=378272 RepID=A0ACB8U315_9APHY|nr:hypothetical protein BDY19DRAFT_195870 [Irpex rosettiformis]
MDNTNIRDQNVLSSRQSSSSKKAAPRRYGRPSIGPGDLTPPSSGSQHEREAPRMLMSPPPEEELQSTRARLNDGRPSSSPAKQRTPGRTPRKQSTQIAKRKRAQHGIVGGSSSVADVGDRVPVASTSQVTIEATPNPKARKQAKHDVLSIPDGPKTPTKAPRGRALTSPTKLALLQSPHATNPNADFIPPLYEISRSSVTKHYTHTSIPYYEPPVDRFTPPREVVYTPVPSVSKSSKRKSLPGSQTKGKGRRLTIQIKKEPPEIDLSAPLPPASPTDDPLLLYGPPPSTTKRIRLPSVSTLPTNARDTPPMSSSPVRPPQGFLIDMTMGEDIDNNDGTYDIYERPLPPVFSFPREDAESLVEALREQTPTVVRDGDYGEHYTVHSVPTKADPPSSCTKERMDRWGRPVSPFPYQLSHSPIPESPVQKGKDKSEVADIEASPARLHPAILAAADLAQTALQPKALDDDLDESEPPPSTSPSIPSSPFASRLEESSAPIAVTDEDDLPPSDPPLSPDAVYDDGSSDGYYIGHDTIAEYEVPLAGNDSSSEPGDFHLNDDVPGFSELSHSTHEGPINSPDDHDHAEHHTANKVHKQLSIAVECVSEEVTASYQLLAAIEISRTELVEASCDALSEWSTAVDEGDEDGVGVEDAESVVRELSHEPDFRDDNDFRDLLPATPQSTKLQVVTNPHNPFDTHPIASAVAKEPSHDHKEASTAYRAQQQLASRNVAHDVEVIESPMDDGDGLEDFDPSVIKITSDDPMAAARAAAILRLHKYDCLEKPTASKRPPSLLQSVLRNSRRKSVAQSGINKSTPTSAYRRRSLGGMIGDRVIRPSIPAVTLPELLREAEESLIMEDEGLSISLPRGSDAPTEHSSPALKALGHIATKSISHVGPDTSDPRDWSKMDWKTLDGCYTDERILLAAKTGLAEGSLASAEQIDPQTVADRFVGLMGGEHVVGNMGSAFTRENLLKRVRALRRKQNSGNIAPPCYSPPKKSIANYLDTSQNFSMLMSPNSSFFGDLLSMPRPMPGHEKPFTTIDPPCISPQAASTRNAEPVVPGPSSLSLTGKVKGLIASYLPKASRPADSSRLPLPTKGIILPPPPSELFRKPRPVIATPVPKLHAKRISPRDLVQLNPVGRSTSSRLPRPVQMQPPTFSNAIPNTASRERRDNCMSVKDLVKSFESIEQAAECELTQVLEIKRRKSVHKCNGSMSNLKSVQPA